MEQKGVSLLGPERSENETFLIYNWLPREAFFTDSLRGMKLCWLPDCRRPFGDRGRDRRGGPRGGPRGGRGGRGGGRDFGRGGGSFGGRDGPPFGGSLKGKQPGGRLRKPFWDMATLEPFKKEFYVPSATVMSRWVFSK